MADSLVDVRVLIISANPLVRVGLVAMLADACEVVGEATSDDNLLDSIEAHQPDVLLWDLGWDTTPALESLSDLSAADALPPVVGLLASVDDFADAQSAGARGLLLQDSSADQITAALIAVTQDLVVLDPAFVQEDLPTDALEQDLTPREKEVLQLLAEGLPNKHIARQLEVSEHTVKFHVNAIFNKLGVQSRTEAVVRATRLGLIIL